MKLTGQQHSSDALNLSEASWEGGPSCVGSHSPRRPPAGCVARASAAQSHLPWPWAALLAVKLAESPLSSILFIKILISKVANAFMMKGILRLGN